MTTPRVFQEGEEKSQQPEWTGIDVRVADVLAVCGQGVYDDGTY